MFKFKRNDNNIKDFMEGYDLGYRAGRFRKICQR